MNTTMHQIFFVQLEVKSSMVRRKNGFPWRIYSETSHPTRVMGREDAKKSQAYPQRIWLPYETPHKEHYKLGPTQAQMYMNKTSHYTTSCELGKDKKGIGSLDKKLIRITLFSWSYLFNYSCPNLECNFASSFKLQCVCIRLELHSLYDGAFFDRKGYQSTKFFEIVHQYWTERSQAFKSLTPLGWESRSFKNIMDLHRKDKDGITPSHFLNLSSFSTIYNQNIFGQHIQSQIFFIVLQSVKPMKNLAQWAMVVMVVI